MLSSVTLNCQVIIIVINSCYQMSEMSTISHKLTSYAMSLSWSLYLYLSLALSLVMSPHHSDQVYQRSQVSRITLWRYSPNFAVVFGQVMSPHHSDQMSQRSQVSRITLWRCSLMYLSFSVSLFFLVRSSPLITLIKCFKGHKSLGSVFEGVL